MRYVRTGQGWGDLSLHPTLFCGEDYSRGSPRVRFIHTADIHLDSPFAGLADKTEAPVERLMGCTRHALRNLVDYAIQGMHRLRCYRG